MTFVTKFLSQSGPGNVGAYLPMEGYSCQLMIFE